MITYNLEFFCNECGERHLTDRKLKPLNFHPEGTSLAKAFGETNATGFADYCPTLNKRTVQADFDKVFLIIADNTSTKRIKRKQ
jgi:hypothetical protein